MTVQGLALRTAVQMAQARRAEELQPHGRQQKERTVKRTAEPRLSHRYPQAISWVPGWR